MAFLADNRTPRELEEIHDERRHFVRMLIFYIVVIVFFGFIGESELPVNRSTGPKSPKTSPPQCNAFNSTTAAAASNHSSLETGYLLLKVSMLLLSYSSALVSIMVIIYLSFDIFFPRGFIFCHQLLEIETPFVSIEERLGELESRNG